jgi:hypothetical protein
MNSFLDLDLSKTKGTIVYNINNDFTREKPFEPYNPNNPVIKPFEPFNPNNPVIKPFEPFKPNVIYEPHNPFAPNKPPTFIPEPVHFTFVPKDFYDVAAHGLLVRNVYKDPLPMDIDNFCSAVVCNYCHKNNLQVYIHKNYLNLCLTCTEKILDSPPLNFKQNNF